MISTYHSHDTRTVTVRGKEVAKPVSVLDYNKSMGGVDLKDQLLHSYLIKRKRMNKWHMKLFRRLLNASILNSMIVYRSNTGNYQADSHDFIFQQDGAPPHWHLMVQVFIMKKCPSDGLVGRGPQDLALCAWPARSPDLTVCDFFLWGYVKDHVYVPPLPTNLNDLKHRITTAINSVHHDMLICAWEEFSYCSDVARAAGGGHTEYL
ncbi:hypothetical protein B7P43_G06172 [Cryptotermes secundus]|uniref:PiggyBac transposable element-derived protein domain-containing protein n=1 Tax=Cryptotermes secundus TaxID=105785 RepID=A0A2J7QQP2_9NEOP|nr:hypothetical protein B7P43_G06172 [Cryptotermes secundus]